MYRDNSIVNRHIVSVDTIHYSAQMMGTILQTMHTHYIGDCRESKVTSMSRWRCPRMLNCGSDTSGDIWTELWPLFHAYFRSDIV